MNQYVLTHTSYSKSILSAGKLIETNYEKAFIKDRYMLIDYNEYIFYASRLLLFLMSQNL